MTRKSIFVLVLLAMVLSASTVLAGGGITTQYIEDVGLVPRYADGRLNAFDITAPVAVFAVSTQVPILDEYGQQAWNDEVPLYRDVLDRYELWGYLPGTDIVDKVLEVSAADVLAAQASGAVYQAETYGYTVTFAPAAGTYTVSAPAYGYSFQW